MNGGDWDALRLSLAVGVLSVLLVLPVATLAARCLSRASFRGRSVVEAALLSPLVLPPVVTGLFLLRVFGRRAFVGGLFDAIGFGVPFTFRAAVMAAAVVSFPLGYRAARVAFDAIDPRLEGVARTLGASRIDAFVTVSLPLARRGLVAAGLLTFVRAMGEFGATVVLAGNVPGVTRTLPLQIYTLIQVGGPASDRAVVVLSLVSVAVSLVALLLIESLGRRRTA